MPNENEVHEMLSLIRQVHIRMSSYYTQTLSTYKLTVQHYTLMFLLIYEGQMKMNAIAKRLSVTNPAVTNIVDQLEKQDYTKRVPSQKDRRVIFIEITENGRQWINNVQAKTINLFSETFSSLNIEERNHIVKFYQTFIKNFDTRIHHENNQTITE